MKETRWIAHHSLFVVLLVLFLLIGALDILNVDAIVYRALCGALYSVTKSPCTDYYDVPIWQVYLSIAILAALAHVHSELRISNRHLAAHKH
jgi:hypothetical protein